MSPALEVPPTGFEEHSIEEKIEYAQALYGEISANEAHVGVPAWHQALLGERLAEFEADPDGGEAWEVVEAELAARNLRD